MEGGGGGVSGGEPVELSGQVRGGSRSLVKAPNQVCLVRPNPGKTQVKELENPSTERRRKLWDCHDAKS